MSDEEPNGLTMQKCSLCGEGGIWWDDETPVMCNDCLRVVLADTRRRAESAEAEIPRFTTAVRDANRMIQEQADKRVTAAEARAEQAERERDEARAHAARLRLALASIEEHVAGLPGVAAGNVHGEVKAALAATEAGSARLWRAMERACEVADEFCAAFTIVKGPPAVAQRDLAAALAEVEAARKEGER